MNYKGIPKLLQFIPNQNGTHTGENYKSTKAVNKSKSCSQKNQISYIYDFEKTNSGK